MSLHLIIEESTLQFKEAGNLVKI